MFQSWLRLCPTTPKRPATFRPTLDRLDDRIVPANPHFVTASSTTTAGGALVVSWKEAGLGDMLKVRTIEEALQRHPVQELVPLTARRVS